MNATRNAQEETCEDNRKKDVTNGQFRYNTLKALLSLSDNSAERSLDDVYRLRDAALQFVLCGFKNFQTCEEFGVTVYRLLKILQVNKTLITNIRLNKTSDTEDFKIKGSGIYTTLALINHGSVSNVVIIFYGSLAVVCVARPI